MEALRFIQSNKQVVKKLLELFASRTKISKGPRPFANFQEAYSRGRLSNGEIYVILWYMSYTTLYDDHTLRDFIIHINYTVLLAYEQSTTRSLVIDDYADIDLYKLLQLEGSPPSVDNSTKSTYTPQSGKEKDLTGEKDDNLWSILSTDTKIAWGTTLALAVAVPAGAPLTIATSGLIKHIGVYAILGTTRNIGVKVGEFLKNCKTDDESSISDDESVKNNDSEDISEFKSQSGAEMEMDAMQAAVEGRPTPQERRAQRDANGDFDTTTMNSSRPRQHSTVTTTTQQTNSEAWNSLNSMWKGQKFESTSSSRGAPRGERYSTVGGL